VLDNFPVVVEPKDIDSRVIIVPWPLLMTMQHDVVAISEGTFELNSLARVLGGHPLEVLDKRLFAVGDIWVVLNVSIAGILLDRLARLALIKHQVIEGLRISFVLLYDVAHLSGNSCLTSAWWVLDK
jgi:hypothetical protein